MTTVAIIDVETTGMRAGPDRVVEIGAVVVRDGAVAATFERLCDPGFPIPWAITRLTGISTAMVRGRPRPEAAMPDLRAFLGDLPCVAHNADFDRRFLAAEMARAGIDHDPPFLCTVLLARRLVPDAPACRLGVLAEHLGLEPPPGGRAHRALADALVTAQLWLGLVERTAERLGRDPDHGLLAELMRVPRPALRTWFAARRSTG